MIEWQMHLTRNYFEPTSYMIEFNENELSDKDFKVDYEKVDFKTYEAESKKTFDILVNW